LRRSFFQSSRYKTSIAGAADLILSKKAGVSNLCIAEEEEQSKPAPNVAKLNQSVVNQNVFAGKDAMEAILHSRNASRAAGEPFAIFRIGIVILDSI